MSAIRQIRAREIEVASAPGPDELNTGPGAAADNPLQLLREAIARLNSSHGNLPDQGQVAKLLAEAREALEHANIVAAAVAQCDECLRATQFEKAFEALDGALGAYPADPVLMARRREVERHQKAFHSGVAARTALEEAQWLQDQDRPDLAAQFLRQKVTELPEQSVLAARLEELEAALPRWEQNRQVQAALARVSTLQQIQQWQVALTILEEAMQSYPASAELTKAADGLREQLQDHERQKKLARRLELIQQKMAEQSWRQALTLLENTQKEFPEAPELISLRLQVDTGLKRSECEAVLTEVRQCIADGDPAQAEQVLLIGLEVLGPEPSLEALRTELQTEKEYREELRSAQVLFGRRQFQEAERILIGLVTPDRPDAQTLLDAVREARAATEEENFCERGREKALLLMHQQQYTQAADLLRNLLLLFPGNAILERDLAAAMNAAGPAPEAVLPAKVEPEPAEPAVVVPLPPPPSPTGIPLNPALRTAAGQPAPRMRRVAMVGTASLVLVSASVAAWRFSRPTALPPPPIAIRVPAATPLPVTTLPPTPAAVSQPAEPVQQVEARRENSNVTKTHTPAPTRTFVPPPSKSPAAQPANSSLGQPAVTVSASTPVSIPALPSELVKPVGNPVPPPQPAPATAAAAQPKPTIPVGGQYVEPQVIERPLPDYPALARQRGVHGNVRMEASIDEKGSVTSVRVLSGDVILAAAAKTTVMKWKYKPGTLNGRPIPTQMNVQVSFGERK